MIDFFHIQPNAIRTGFDNTIFYYGVKPNGLSQLAISTEFMLVYSPSQEYEWEAVLYRVLQPNKTYWVVDRRDLLLHEIEHFERLLKQANNTSSNQQMTFSLIPAY